MTINNKITLCRKDKFLPIYSPSITLLHKQRFPTFMSRFYNLKSKSLVPNKQTNRYSTHYTNIVYSDITLTVRTRTVESSKPEYKFWLPHLAAV